MRTGSYSAANLGSYRLLGVKEARVEGHQAVTFRPGSIVYEILKKTFTRTQPLPPTITSVFIEIFSSQGR